MDQLRADNAQLSQQVALLTAQVAQMRAVRPCRKCPVAVPDKFDGSLAHFPAFFGQCQLYMSLRPEDFPTDRDKVGFLISLLSDYAARWAMPIHTPSQSTFIRTVPGTYWENPELNLPGFPTKSQATTHILFSSSPDHVHQSQSKF
uniref:DUF4939 domain-containing protein n=1 Tax=Naja naja TaxID=35670 RepID=A0A8C6YA83_NAJNA